MFVTGQGVSTSDSDQVKPAGKDDYVNVKPVRPASVFAAIKVVINKKHTKFIYLYTIIYSCTVNENFMLICIELSEI